MDADPASPLLLSRSGLFPVVGAPIHVNTPIHEGDVPLHRHDFYEIALVSSGRGLHHTARGLVQASAGDVFILPPGEQHAYVRCRELRVTNCCFGGDLLAGPLAWLSTDPQLGGLLGLAGTAPGARRHLGPAALQRCLAILERLRMQQADHPEQARASLIGHLLVFLGELVSATGEGAPARLPACPPVIARSMETMAQRLAAPWSLSQLSAAAGLERAAFMRLFRRHTGLTPINWLARMRGEHAAILLLTSERSIAAIGAEVGWPDPGYFTRRFKTLFGETPGHYRRHGEPPLRDPEVAQWIQW